MSRFAPSRLHESVRAFHYRRPRVWGLILGLGLLAMLCGIEALLDHAPSARQLYLLPVWLTTRIGGRLVGMAVVIATSAAMTAIDASLGLYPDQTRLLLDATIRLVTFTGLLLLVHQIEGTLQAAQRFASRDELTGVLNRRGFMKTAEYAIETARRTGSDLAVMVVDCDNFKAVNDRHGHAKGDRVLQKLAEVLKHESRSGDVVARVGGDEFIVLLQGSGAYGVAAFHLRIVDRFREMVQELGVPEVSISAGAAFLGQHGDTVMELLEHADSVMYDLKSKSTFSPFSAAG